MPMGYSEAQKMAWLEKLGNFDPQDPKPGNYKIIICPATNEAFADRAATQRYTQRTGHTDFAIVNCTVKKSDIKQRLQPTRPAAVNRHPPSRAAPAPKVTTFLTVLGG